MSTLGTDRQQKGDWPGFEYDVALSFAEEDRAFVANVARRLKWLNVKVYYYKEANNDADLWGTDLYHHLKNIYKYKSRFCVMFISRHYKEKFWTRREQEWVQARDLINEKGEYILPFRFDDTEVDGIKPNIHFLSVKQYNARRLARVIEVKVRGHQHSRARSLGILLTADLVYQHTCDLVGKYRKALLKASIAMSILIIGLVFRDNITPADVLSGVLYERNATVVRGSVCRDGSFSKARGQGACSHHEGVAAFKDSLVHAKSMEECRREAKEISLLP